ncbi:hypothetical protein D3C74_334740 [compost metagenome]
MMHLPMRMENPFRMLFITAVVAKHDIHFIAAVLASANDRSYRIVRNLVPIHIAKCQHVYFRIAVSFPLLVDLICRFKQGSLILPVQAEHRHRPMHHAGGNSRVPFMLKCRFNRSSLQRKGMFPPLEVIMRQNRAADNRQICIRPYEVMRELRCKIEQAFKG